MTAKKKPAHDAAPAESAPAEGAVPAPAFSAAPASHTTSPVTSHTTSYVTPPGGDPSASGETPAAAAPAADYDRFVDWDRRLTREGPFFADLFEAHDVREVIDVGAGSGKHAIMFARWGKRVVAADPDESMLAQARANLGEAEDDIAASGGDLKIVEAGFGHLALHDLGPVDAITCTGNALPHVAGHDGLAAALRDFHAVLRPGGVVVLHLLNHQRLLDNRVRSIPPVVRVAEDGTMTVFLRVIDYPEGGEYIDFDFLTLTRPPDGVWQTASRRSAHTALPIATLTTALQQAGFGDVRAYGSHDGTPLEIDADESVLLTAERL